MIEPSAALSVSRQCELLGVSRSGYYYQPVAESEENLQLIVHWAKLLRHADDPTNHKLLMVLEYVEGGSLFAGTKISPKKRLSELAARKYFRDVLQASSLTLLPSRISSEVRTC